MKPAKKRKEITLWTLLWTVFKWRWWQLGVCLALSITNSTIGLYLPQFAGALMDKIPHVQRWEDVEPLFWKIIIWTFIAGCISLAQQYLENVVDLFLSLHSQNYVLHLLMGKDMDFFLHPLCEPRMLPSRVSQDAKELAFLVHTFSFQVINTFYGLALTIIILFTGVNMPVKTLLIGLAAHPFSAIITILIGHYSESMTIEVAGIGSRMGRATIELITNVPFIKINQSMREVKMVRLKEQYELYDAQNKITRMRTTIDIFILIWTTMISPSVLILGIQDTISGKMTWGAYTVFQGYLRGISGRLSGCFSLYITFKKSWGTVNNLADMLRTPVEIEDTEGDVYRTERPRANELPEFVGSPVAQVIRQSLAQMRGYIQIPGLELHRMLTQIYGPSAWKGPAPPSSKESEDPNLPPEGKKKKEAKPWLLEYTDNPKPWSLEFRNVSFHYPSYKVDESKPNRYELPRKEDKSNIKPVLKEWSEKIDAGSIVVLLGSNGAGKSTIMHLVAQLYRAKSGQILIDGQDITSMNVCVLRSHLGYLIQQTPLFTGDVLSNIFAGHNGPLVPESIREQQKKLVNDFVERTGFPLDLDLDQTLQGTRGVSGGQQQKIALLRLMLHKYSLLIFDEPTNNLDHATNEWLMSWISSIKTARDEKVPNAYTPTIIVVTHQSELKGVADREIRLPSQSQQQAMMMRRMPPGMQMQMGMGMGMPRPPLAMMPPGMPPGSMMMKPGSMMMKPGMPPGMMMRGMVALPLHDPERMKIETILKLIRSLPPDQSQAIIKILTMPTLPSDSSTSPASTSEPTKASTPV